MSVRRRLIVLGVVCVLAIAGSVAYLLNSKHQRQVANRDASGVAETSLASVSHEPRIVFRNTALGSNYGKVAVVPIDDPGGPRAFTGASCDRVYAAEQKMLCLSSNIGVVTTYNAAVLNAAGTSTEATLPLAGIPSRARLSHDGTLAATTSFTAGDSYTNSGFSTRTVISGLSGASTNANLENFQLVHNGVDIKPVDRNYWGVTFARDNDTFYATVAWGGHTWLVRGSIKARKMVTLHEDAECPSLSPDGKNIVYKKRSGAPAGQWRLVAYSIATGTETRLAESTNVDDQVDWLNDNTILYGIPRTGSQAAIDDIYELPADGTGSPKLLIPQAWSPAVVQ
jgi:hypothetical protein